ncbi:MAG: type II toxin-antitoxin system VapC family toxin [Thaumarchaeota archaeon]|nr:type II toxin-antitoxin system VapC family toxin [Nitrososphaerota archaeon]
METQAILDTTVIIDHLKRRPTPEANQIFHEINSGTLRASTTSITAFEIYRGARKAPHPEDRLAEAEALLTHLPCLPFDKDAAKSASEITATLEKKGLAIEIRDLLIGAIAKLHEQPLVTSNTKHFTRIPSLKVMSPKELLTQPRRTEH